MSLIDLITSPNPATRNCSLDDLCAHMTLSELQAECAALDDFRRSRDNLYERVRALFFLYAIHRFHIIPRLEQARAKGAMISHEGHVKLLDRQFDAAIDTFLKAQADDGPSEAISSALAAAYHRLAFQTLANQVRRSVQSVPGNQWMFAPMRVEDHPLKIHPDLLGKGDRPYDHAHSIQLSGATLREQTPVRMDLSHSGWSDIFFLGMDFPEGARVMNISVDLGVRGRDAQPRPPVEAYVRVINQPILRLRSVDLKACAEISELSEVFDFARDYLGLLKAAVIASGVIPPALENTETPLSEVLAQLAGPGMGLEITSHVNDIPKGSRLAVSTTLLAALIAALMRATSQTKSLTGGLSEDERRLVAARAVLGEWLAGSGGGWQDSGGVWPGVKRIEGALAQPGDPEHGISRGTLLPHHTLLPMESAAGVIEQIQRSLVLVHGGMAQNVGPILEMVTEKYLLRSEPEWTARQEAMRIYDEIVKETSAPGGLTARSATLASLTNRNFAGPLQIIIPQAGNLYTQTLIERARAKFGTDFLGFWMLGGMSGGGMGFWFAPHRLNEAKERMAEILRQTKRELETALPFAMEPVVYDFAVNPRGTWAEMSFLPSSWEKPEVANETESEPSALPLTPPLTPPNRQGIDTALHERIRAEMRAGKIGLAQNRLPITTKIEDVRESEVMDATTPAESAITQRGLAALQRGEVAVFTLAAGVGSRWTQGAGVVKALHPFAKLGGQYRNFLEAHLARTRRDAERHACDIPHLISTSYLTHDAIAAWQSKTGAAAILSPGRAIGQRFVPMARDLRFAYEEAPQQKLDAQAQKVREGAQAALIGWAQSTGEGSDYTDNVPSQCIHPVGHWFELPNLLRNGALAHVLGAHPNLRTLMLHNVDTLGANVDPAMLGRHLAGSAALTFEVIARQMEDRGGGLARVNGRARLVEGLAMPREDDEFLLSYYNSMTTWIDIDGLLAAFGLARADLRNPARVDEAIGAMAARLPTYITLKDVKKRWGHGQEDVYPVAQFEKLWSDMSALPDVACAYMVVPRSRGQQLKDIAQLDGWLRDGSAAHIEKLCGWSE